MLDVLHFLFEDDWSSVSSSEHADARDAMRLRLYVDLYETTYEFSSSKSFGSGIDGLDPPLEDDEIPIPVDPLEKSKFVKPYTPATDFNPDAAKPFGAVLDAPLG